MSLNIIYIIQIHFTGLYVYVFSWFLYTLCEYVSGVFLLIKRFVWDSNVSGPHEIVTSVVAGMTVPKRSPVWDSRTGSTAPDV